MNEYRIKLTDEYWLWGFRDGEEVRVRNHDYAWCLKWKLRAIAIHKRTLGHYPNSEIVHTEGDGL